MQDKEISTLFLTLEKDIVKGYSSAITEAGTTELKNTVEQLQKSNIEAHRTLFSMMTQNSWYQLQQVEAQKIDNEFTKLSGTLQGIQSGQNS